MSAINLHTSQHGVRKLARHDALEALNDATSWVFETVGEWRRRLRERDQLAHLDERMLSDIGISDAERGYLANKPFWRE
jgi:uncharacterized protein YjiS (DUF1127 family)